MRTRVKQVFTAIEAGDKPAAETAFQAAVPVLDHMARKGLIHKTRLHATKAVLIHRFARFKRFKRFFNMASLI